MPQDEVIQRRWLLNAEIMAHPDVRRIARGRKTFITQGFIYGANGVTVRVRVDQDTYNRDLTRGWVTERSPVGVIRQNTTAAVDPSAARILLRAATRTVDKDRHFIDGYPDLVLDVYFNGENPIYLLEARLGRVDQAVALPEWAKDAREVTLLLDAERIANIVRYGAAPTINLDQLLTGKRPKLVAFEGPPASGKSTILRELAAKAESLGIHVLPEAATLLMHDIGIRPDGTRYFQEALRRFQLGLEETALIDAARRGLRAVIVDRSVMGAAPYIPAGLTYEEVFGRSMINDAKRYEPLIYIGPVPNEDIYNRVRSDNPTRRESYAEMLALHEKGLAIVKECDGIYFKEKRAETGEMLVTGGWSRVTYCLSNDWDAKRAEALTAVRQILDRE